MKKEGHCLGGEQSGHIIFSKYATTGDGLLTSLKIMEIMIAKGCPISKLASELTIFPQVLVNLHVQDKQAVLKDKDVAACIDHIRKVLGKNGRVLVRASGTEPLIRVMIEAETKETCDRFAERIVAKIREKGLAR